MAASRSYLEEVYPYDAATKTFTIQVAVERYDEIFNHLDPTPLHQRDLAPDLMSFLTLCCSEIPARYNLRLRVNIAAQSFDPQLEQQVISGMKHFFLYEYQVLAEQIQRKQRRALRYVLISFTSLTCTWLLHGLPANLFSNFLREGLTIGGWVFLWEAISASFIQKSEIDELRSMYHRLQQAEVRFNYP